MSLDSYGGKPTVKKKSIAKFIEVKEKFGLCDIWRIRNLKLKHIFFNRNMSWFNSKTFLLFLHF